MTDIDPYSIMINSEVKSNVQCNSGTVTPPDQKHSPLVRKIALRDVQNDNRSLIHNHPKVSTFLEGIPIASAIKISGTKRLTPEKPPLYPSLPENGVDDHLVHTRRKFESEPGKGRIQDHTVNCLQPTSKYSCHKQQELTQQQTQMRESKMYCAPVVRSNQIASMSTFPRGVPSVPISLGKHENGLPFAESDYLTVKLEACESIDSMAIDDQQRIGRFLHLQKFLKQCDESSNRDYIQMLLNMSTAERSSHAVELEKRAIQLTVEEGIQMNRMKALNIFGKSGPTNNPLLTTHPSQSET